ncbi:MAG: pyruvate kinase [Thermodesulfovibrionales bacterium]|nr:pyruvate kinase [Thermodesulfovibrionales bacterium]
MERRAKIVCTIGPASISKEVLFSLIKAGMDVARLNFSHGDYAFHRRAVELIREGSKRHDRPVAILQDLQGIKIRAGTFQGGSAALKRGQDVLILPGKGTGNNERIYISYHSLIKDARLGNKILLDDGMMELRVIGKTTAGIRARVIEGGILKDKKGVNLPGMRIRTPSFTEKDAEDLAFGLKLGVDYVAISFVREAQDIRKVKDRLKRHGRLIPLIAKIEKPEAIENIDRILEEADGIMVARGDLGVEVSTEEVPILQKMLIEKANSAGKLVITATQMLESMTEHTRPTRAEAADVANAVLDGTDALMLSAETSSGKYPLKAVSMMDRIIRKTEGQREIKSLYVQGRSFSEAVSEAAARAAEDIEARYIIAFTQSGFTARLVSKFRPSVPIVAFTPGEEVRRRMSLYWGVTPKTMRPLKSTDALFREVEAVLLKEKMARPGDSIVITASAPILGAGKTNLLKLHRIRG